MPVDRMGCNMAVVRAGNGLADPGGPMGPSKAVNDRGGPRAASALLPPRGVPTESPAQGRRGVKAEPAARPPHTCPTIHSQRHEVRQSD